MRGVSNNSNMYFRQLVLVLVSVLGTLAVNAAELRLITHNAFALSKKQIANFERQSGVKLTIIHSGDAGEMVNKLILTKAHPIADIVYGIDNMLTTRATSAGVLDDSYTPRPNSLATGTLLAGGVSIDYGYITLNYDKAWFAKTRLALPKTLDELTHPRYKNLLVVENPATSSTGLGFLLSTIEYFGVERAFDFWARLRTNGVKVVSAWNQAYYMEFSHNRGARPIVVSYASSPAAEVFYSKVPLTESPTANLFLPGAVFRHVEGVALLKGGRSRQAAGQFIEFLRSEAVQKDLQTTMWMYPVIESVALNPIFRYAQQPVEHWTPKESSIDTDGQYWIRRWTRTVLR